jgi:hypothetical protein
LATVFKRKAVRFAPVRRRRGKEKETQDGHGIIIEFCAMNGTNCGPRSASPCAFKTSRNSPRRGEEVVEVAVVMSSRRGFKQPQRRSKSNWRGRDRSQLPRAGNGKKGNERFRWVDDSSRAFCAEMLVSNAITLLIVERVRRRRGFGGEGKRRRGEEERCCKCVGVGDKDGKKNACQDFPADGILATCR